MSLQYTDPHGEPLTKNQMFLWLEQCLTPDASRYNMPFAFIIDAEIDYALFRQALQSVINASEALRTVVREVDGMPRQFVRMEMPLQVPFVDLRGTAESDQEAWAWMQARCAQPFDLGARLFDSALLTLEHGRSIWFLNQHHLITDAWSTTLVFRYMSEQYAALRDHAGERGLSLPPYREYIHAETQYRLSPEHARAEAFWKTKLSTPIEPLRYYGVAAPVDTSPFRRLTRAFGPERTQRFRSAAVSPEYAAVTPDLAQFTALSAMLLAYLYRISGNRVLSIGAPIRNRTTEWLLQMPGLVMEVVPLIVEIEDGETYASLIRKTNSATYEALQHYRYATGNPRHRRAYEVMLNYHTWAYPTFAGHTVAVDWLHAGIATGGMSLQVHDFAGGNDLTVDFDFNAQVFSPEASDNAIGHFLAMVDAFTHDPYTAIDSVDFLSADERQLLPDPCMALSEPPQELVTRLFAQWVQRTPEHIAVSQGAHTWMYRTLAERADRLARVFAAQGMAKGDVVAVYGHRSVGLIASMLGVFWSGGVLLLIDPHLPEHRQRLMLREAAVKHLVFVGNGPPEASWLEHNTPLNILCVDGATGSPGHVAARMDLATVTLPEVVPDDPAYIFFTSGSTGVPKGVLGWHKGLSHFLQWQGDTFDIGPQERVAQLIHLSFDAVLRDIFLPLTRGATLCVPEEQDTLAPQSLLRWLQQERISLLHTIPSLAQSWLAQVPADVFLRELRWVFFSGEPLTDILVRQWRAAFPGSAIVNLYGPTETTMVKCYYVVPPEVLPGIQPAGWPLPQTQALVFAAHSRRCGIGEPGEIVLRTPFRTLGYINAPDDQQQRFVRNPCREDVSDWLYYTGDRGRYRADGMLEILGRLDEQVKIRGIRIEPSEVTATLAQHPAVHACVVVAQKDALGQPALVAYVVAAQHAVVTPGTLRAYLNHHLPAAMIPGRFVLLDQFPLTPNGKVDRQALPLPDWTVSEGGGTFVAPRTPMEELIAAAWAEVLKRDQISIHDNFFDSGGHSLLATQLIARVHEASQVTVPLRQFFEDPTIAGLAVAVTRWQVEQLAEEAMVGLLAEVEGLSPEDVQAHLANDEAQERSQTT